MLELLQHISDLLSTEVDSILLMGIRQHRELLLRIRHFSGGWLPLCSSNSTSKNVSQRYTVKNKDCDSAVLYNILK